ncbi:MAG: zf-HC2 domain-containing protein [Acidobacteria bacterium]|nr:zf-HC2 domain-containing protein [Acidobacteriota bacterium]MBI3657750.1 zf-HC2 domain-containing protein [Acidobacteriota bacterium]
MISCHEVRSCLAQLQDNEVEKGLRIRIEEHIEQCSACLNQFKGLEEVWDLLDDYRGVEPSAEFNLAFWAAAKEIQYSRPTLPRWHAIFWNDNWKIAALAGSMAALLIVFVGILPYYTNYNNDLDKFDNQLLQEVARLVTADDEDPLPNNDASQRINGEKRDLPRNITNPLGL